MALHLMRKVKNFNLLLSRGLICRHSSSSNSSNSSAGGHGDQGKHGNKSGQEAQQSKELANKDFEESSAVEKKDDSTTTLPSLKEKEERQLAQIRKMYEGTGVEVVKHEMFRGITRREGVTGEVFPGTDEPKDLVKVLKGSYGLKKWYRGREPPDQPLLVPRQTDVAIIGGGVMGSAVAFWLKQKYPEGLSVTVVERDPTYTQASTVLSVGGLRQQFSLPENIEMSLYTAEFFRNLRDHLTIHDQDPPDIQFNPQGYLFLATKEGSKTIEQNYTTQCSLGAAVEVMNRDRLKEKFPWLNVDDLECGSYGLEDEGWFDPWSLLTALRSKAIHLGAEYVRGEVVGFRYTNREVKELGGSERQMKDLDGVEVKAEDGNIHPMQFETVINCAGPWAGEVGKLAGIGIDGGELKIPIPVEPRKRYVFVLHCPEGPGLEMPIINDPSGLFVRREGLGGHYICGMSLQPDNEPSCDDLAVDYEYFNEVVWPLLAHRIPTFEKLKANESLHMGVERGVYKKYVQPLITKRIPCLQNAKLRSAWAGYYDYNYFDQNLIVGNHPYHKNFYMATGCSGHGIQQAPAVGKLLMEHMTEGKFKTIDVQRFMFDRLLSNKRILEQNIV